jgi:hypothetical protein
MANETAKYAFLPWVRQGAASSIETVDSLGANQAGFVSIPVSLSINNTQLISRQIRFYGPGDVIGIDRQQVIRTDPRAGATDFEPNYFPLIEFDRPDFPWLFTPAKAEGAGKLRPWLCLVVVRKQEGVELHTDPNQPLPVLVIQHPQQELPDLSESWAWVHAQVTHGEQVASPLGDLLAGNPALNLSRLLSPRRLDPSTDYLACLVPTFKLGLKAGLGIPIETDDEKNLMPAWDFKAEPLDEIHLPIYYYWEFRTGVGGDFEELARLLEPGAPDERVGRRPIDIGQPGFHINSQLPSSTILQLEGALRIPVPEDQTSDDPSKNWSETSRIPFQTALKEILNAPWEAIKDAAKQSEEPLLAPPVYGCWQAAKHLVEVPAEPPASSSLPPWLHELNLDPRHRSVAALGTQVTQVQQEQLMASAWEQLGEIERINQMRRQAQLGRAVNSVYYNRHFTPLPSETFLKVVSSAQSRLVVSAEDARTRILLSHKITQSAIPDRAVSAPMRRWTNPRSPVSTRFQPAAKRPISIMTRLNSPGSVVALRRIDAGAITIDRVSTRTGGDGTASPVIRFDDVSAVLASGAPLAHYNGAAEGDSARLLDPLITPPIPSDPLSIPDSPFAAAFRRLAIAQHDYLNYKLFMTFFHNYRFVFPGDNGIIYGVDSMGRLMFFRHQIENEKDMITGPSVIGQGGWQNFKFVFSGGKGIIYAVDQKGQFFFYQDKAQDGTGDVANPLLIGISFVKGQPGWLDKKFIFSGGNGIIYAVNETGQLRFYQDKTQDGKSMLGRNTVIGQGGWQVFKFLFSGGNGIIYAVDQNGNLLFYRDKMQDGTGDVANPSVIGQGGWQNHKFLFAGGDGTIYAVDQQGTLLLTHDETLDGSRLLSAPVAIGQKAKSSSAPPMDLEQTKAIVLRSVNPEKTITARISASLRLAEDHRETEDPLEPLLDAPNFPQPMYEALRDLSQDYLLPGLEHVSPNTVTVLEANPEFIESFLVGLNHEMGHELLWRGYPTDQRGTYFRQFWDSLTDDEVPSPDGARDIDRIKDWGNKELGANVHNGKALVLLIRGELLRRYPNSVIYAVEAVRHKDDGLLYLTENEVHPLFRGSLKPDVTFLGFPLTVPVVLGEPGWFFVIQEQPTEPRFGMDMADFDGPAPSLATWNDLSWQHIANTEKELQALSYVAVNPAPPAIKNLSETDEAKWGQNAAHQAYITLQRPVRIAIHARQMIAQ